MTPLEWGLAGLAALLVLWAIPVLLFSVLAARLDRADRRAARRRDDTTLNAALEFPTGRVVVDDPAETFAAIAASMPDLADAPQRMDGLYLVPDEAWGGAR